MPQNPQPHSQKLQPFNTFAEIVLFLAQPGTAFGTSIKVALRTGITGAIHPTIHQELHS